MHMHVQMHHVHMHVQMQMQMQMPMHMPMHMPMRMHLGAVLACALLLPPRSEDGRDGREDGRVHGAALPRGWGAGARRVLGCDATKGVSRSALPLRAGACESLGGPRASRLCFHPSICCCSCSKLAALVGALGGR